MDESPGKKFVGSLKWGKNPFLFTFSLLPKERYSKSLFFFPMDFHDAFPTRVGGFSSNCEMTSFEMGVLHQGKRATKIVNTPKPERVTFV